ncbi:hypothetical protein GIB67_038700 [Kingdonia uniflora]|uniref:AT-hook motif nuclear-localized protein n=1 Tax=Kingdonia uniflora TaxID=39325 RepID=A0A7J7NSI7_9MAGN|nr:hypothetical protein GIB67_038700 [Kingdonia uniflora]
MDSQKPTTMGNPNTSRVPFSATVTTFSLTTHNHASNSNGFSLISGETGARRKRGRPRRYGGDGANVKLYRKTGGSSGRSMGWGKKQQFDALGIAGTGFSADMITVKAGEVGV